MTSPHVLWLGLLEGPSGYADEARGFLRVLENAGGAPASRSILNGGTTQLNAADRAMLDAQHARDATGAKVAVHHYAPGWAPDAPQVAGIANVARTMFETDRVPRAWLPQLLQRDEVWVPSPQGAEAFERGGVPSGRIRVVGGTLDFDLYRPGLDPYPLGTPPGHLVFLSNFEFTERKAWRQLLAAWARAFDPADPVTLVLKAAARGGDGQLRARVREEVQQAARRAGKPDAAPVRVMTENLSTADLARLYAAADAYVLPSRGEGWGRPYMEAMAMGLPTVASRFSGNLAFMSDETSWLVGGELVDVPSDHGVFGDDVTGHRWFEPDVEELAQVLADIARDPDAARAKAAAARPDLIARFGPDATRDALQTALSEAAERKASRTTSLVLRGPFGRHASLNVVNDALLDGLEQRHGREVLTRPQAAPPTAVAAIGVSHSWPPDFGAAALGPSVVILPWEYGDPPREWRDRACSEIDRVVVPSDYVKRGYVDAGMPPGAVEVVPNGVDLATFTPDGPKRALEQRAGTVFLFVGGAIWRKGPDLLLAAWQRAFGPDDDVLLVVKDFGADSHYRASTQRAAIRAAASRTDIAPVLHLTDHLAPEELPALYRAADALVAPYRGEGFCLPILEAMACGVPVVHPEEGPSPEFAPPAAGWTVPATRTGIDAGGLPPLAGEGYVHEVDVDALARALQAVAGDPEARAAKAQAARPAAERYGWDSAAARMEEVLATIEREALPPVRDVVAERPESRGTLVAYAPDWSDDASWTHALTAWVEHVDPDADVTLALCVEEARAQDVAERVMAFLDTLGGEAPDLALHCRPNADPLPLVLGADAVLLDTAQERDPSPRLHRRARRIHTLATIGDAFKTIVVAPTTRA